MHYGDPRRSFRRGLFLGLTTAEISILLVFVLLLLFLNENLSEGDAPGGPPPGASVDDVWRRGRAALREAERQLEAARAEAREWQELTREAQRENRGLTARLANLSQTLAAQRRAVAANPADPLRAEVRHLEARIDEKNEELLAVRDRLAASEERTRTLEQTVGNLNEEAERNERAGREIRAELRATRARAVRAEAQLSQDGTGPGGTGSDHPSCWYDDDGDVEYVWDVALHERGFLLRPGPAPANAHQRLVLPLNATTTGRYITAAQFVEQTRPLYDWSVRRDCRFFVRAYDDTPATAKALYQSRMRTLEGHFYKNASPSGSPPRP